MQAFLQRSHMPACYQWRRVGASPAGASALPGGSKAPESDGLPATFELQRAFSLQQALDDEEAMRIGIAHFDMFHAALQRLSSLAPPVHRRLGLTTVSPHLAPLLYVLEVPGLHEGKPPVFRGDSVHVRLEGSEEFLE